MANELIPYWLPGQTITCEAEAAVTGKRAVAISGPRVGGNPQVSPTATSEDLFGIAAYDAAAGDKVTVFVGRLVLPMEASGAITAGDHLVLGAAGVVSTAAPGAGVTAPVIGIAVDDAADGDDVPVALAASAIVGA